MQWAAWRSPDAHSGTAMRQLGALRCDLLEPRLEGEAFESGWNKEKIKVGFYNERLGKGFKMLRFQGVPRAEGWRTINTTGKLVRSLSLGSKLADARSKIGEGEVAGK